MLTTEVRPAYLHNVNIRIEKHGADRSPAADLKLSFQVNSEELDLIEPGLKETLYRQPKSGDQLHLGATPVSWAVLRHPGLEPVRLKGKFPGYELTLAPDLPGATDGDELPAVDVELKKITVDAHDGGTATVTLTVSFPVTPDEVALSTQFLQEGNLFLTLTPPSVRAHDSASTSDVANATEAMP